jgi:hypothetical protein
VSRKPLSIAMEEIEVGKIAAVALPSDEELAVEGQPQLDVAARNNVDTSRGARREKYASLWKVRPAPSPRAPRKKS